LGGVVVFPPDNHRLLTFFIPRTVFPGTPQLTTATPAGLSDSMTRSRTSAQFVGFRLADQDYAFRIEQIQEIVIPDRLTQLPQVPDYIEGVSNLRGTIIPVVSLRRLLNLPAVPRDSETRTIVVNVQPRVIGCTVDSVTQVLRIARGEILPAPYILWRRWLFYRRIRKGRFAACDAFERSALA